LLAAASSQVLRTWDLSTSEELARIFCCSVRFKLGNSNLAFSPNGKTLAGRDYLMSNLLWERISLWDPRTGRVMHTFVLADDERFDAITFSSDSRILACGKTRLGHRDKYNNSTIVLYDIDTGRQLEELMGLREPATTLSFLERDHVLLAFSRDCVLRTWNITRATCTSISTLKSFKSNPFPYATSTQSGMVVGICDSFTIFAYDLYRRKYIGPISIPGFETLVCAAGTDLIAFSSDSGVGTWNPRTGKVRKDDPQTLEGTVAISHDGSIMAQGASNGVIKFWDIDGSGRVRNCRTIG
jgi:WD40 repeat protein